MSEKEAIESQKASLNKALTEQLSLHNTLVKDQAKLRRESQQIQKELELKKEAIDAMTIDQVKAELIKSQQEQLIYEMKSQDSLNLQSCSKGLKIKSYYSAKVNRSENFI